MRSLSRLLFAILGVLVATLAAQEHQPLTLNRAVAIALESNPTRKVALMDTKSASASRREARAALLPRIMFSEIALRGNDPVFVFGTKLRQQRFSASDFALNALNRPTPVSDISSRFSGQWTIFDSRQSWLAVSRARLMEQAASQQLERTEQELVFRVVQAYYAALAAARRVEISGQSVKTAEAIEERSRSRVENGLAVESDLLTAQVQTASRKQEQIRARNDLAIAKAELAIALGVSADTVFELSDIQPENTPQPAAAIAELESKALAGRPDLKRIRSEQAAQGKSLAIARAGFGPRVNAFGSWQTDSRSLAWNGGNNWTAGVEVQIDLFAGGAKVAQLSRERANRERIEAMRQMAEDSVRLELRRAYYEADAARQQVDVARGATAQAEESLRIQRNRYEAGLTTIAELLRVEEASHRAQTDYWDAVYRAATGNAALELATGTLTPSSSVVNP